MNDFGEGSVMNKGAGLVGFVALFSLLLLGVALTGAAIVELTLDS